MIQVKIRKQGGAAIMTIPANILKQIHIDIGSTVEIELHDQTFIVKPVTEERKRYSLKELLHKATPAAMRRLNKETEWAREGKSKGRELT